MCQGSSSIEHGLSVLGSLSEGNQSLNQLVFSKHIVFIAFRVLGPSYPILTARQLLDFLALIGPQASFLGVGYHELFEKVIVVEDVLEGFGDLPVDEVQVRDLLSDANRVKDKLGCIVCGLSRINVSCLDRAGVVLQILIVEPAEGVD